MNNVTLADVINRAIIVGETRRMARMLHDKWSTVVAIQAERSLETAIHEFARNNHTKPF